MAPDSGAAPPIEDYAMIGNTCTAALVHRQGSIDWLCLPRFDSPSCFASLLGGPEHGCWIITPAAPVRRVSRRYRPGTLVLETTLETADGAVTLVDFMPPPRHGLVDVLRLVKGLRGKVAMTMQLVLRFDYGLVVPWVRRDERGYHAVAGPDAVRVWTPVALRGKDYTTVADFTVGDGQTVPFQLTWWQAHEPEPTELDAAKMLDTTEAWWREWSDRCTLQGQWREPVLASLVTLKGLTYSPTGAIVAAPTTSLPEQFGGSRNWDYRYCWLRDATFTLYALLSSGYTEEAAAWREWLLRAIAGDHEKLQIVYGLAGERRLTELELPWLPGYAGNGPVRIGNAAYAQRQLDVYGEVMDALYVARRHQIEFEDDSWEVQRKLMDVLESRWDKPDRGLWEMRGGDRHFTHSKMMAWVAFDRAIKTMERFEIEGPLQRWRQTRDRIHAEVCDKGFSRKRGAFVQSYEAEDLDAALLLMPLVGFLPAKDPRVRGTVEAIMRDLTADGLVMRYRTNKSVDGLPPGEGLFLACSFWLVDNLTLLGRYDEAEALFARLLGLRNDVGLLAEEYDPRSRRQCGNFPQAFSHVALVNSAQNLSKVRGPAKSRAEQPAAAAD